MGTEEHNPEGQLKGFIFRHRRRLETLMRKHGRWLYPVEPACTAKPCKAHSIQNRVVLSSLAENGHVGSTAMIPTLLFILFVQRHLVRGLTLGGLRE